MTLPARPQGPVLFAYDGSDGARAAIEQAGATLANGPAIVATAWTTLEAVAATALIAMPRGTVAESVHLIDAATRTQAEETAADGAALARDAGFAAEPRAVGGASPPVRSLLDIAEEIDARVIVLGSRGRSPMAAVLLGSVSAGVVHHAHRPVLVIPPPKR